MNSSNRRHQLPFLYKYCTASTALAVLETQTLRWSSPLLFNDPFDVPRKWEGPTYEELEQALVERFKVYLAGGASPKSEAAQTLLAAQAARQPSKDEATFLVEMRFFLRLMRPKLERHLEEMRVAWREKIPGMRILCLSEDAGSAAMWAHYAQNHSGVVFEFESSDERDSVFLLAEPVQYRREKPSLPSATEWVRAFMGEVDLDWDRFLAEYQFVKDVNWSYEREHRVVSGRKADETELFSDYVFHREDLHAVVLGAQVSPNDEASVRAAVEAAYPGTKIDRAEIDLGIRRITRIAA